MSVQFLERMLQLGPAMPGQVGCATHGCAIIVGEQISYRIVTGPAVTSKFLMR